jgi:hypothetical protein
MVNESPVQNAQFPQPSASAPPSSGVAQVEVEGAPLLESELRLLGVRGEPDRLVWFPSIAIGIDQGEPDDALEESRARNSSLPIRFSTAQVWCEGTAVVYGPTDKRRL